MATVNRAKSFLIYLIAISISAVFSFVGRSSPAWAEVVTTKQNAKIFQERFSDAQGPQGQNAPSKRSTLASATSSGGNVSRDVAVTGSEVPLYSPDKGGIISEPIKADIDNRIMNLTDVINQKMTSYPSQVTQEDMSFYLQLENSRKIDELSNQLKVLMRMLKDR